MNKTRNIHTMIVRRLFPEKIILEEIVSDSMQNTSNRKAKPRTKDGAQDIVCVILHRTRPSPSLPASLSLANAVQQNCPVKYANPRLLSIDDTGSGCCAERVRGRRYMDVLWLSIVRGIPLSEALRIIQGTCTDQLDNRFLCSFSDDLMIKVEIQRGGKMKWE